MPTFLRRTLRGFGPAVARPAMAEMLRAALGAGLGLALCNGIAHLLPDATADPAPLLVAPLGATAFLAFAIPNSPLAQPWSAVVGNVVSALVALLIMRQVPLPQLAIALSVSLAILAMMLLRALHPPGAAMALLIAMNPDVATSAGFGYALSPVAEYTVVLVLLAIAYNRATGRVYPFRQPALISPQATTDMPPERRLGLSPESLAQILRDMNLAANIGPEDLARLIAAAEAQATAQHFNGLTAADVMSRDLITVAPTAPVPALAGLFQRHRVKSLPVVAADREFLGLVPASALLTRQDDPAITAKDLMEPETPVRPDTPLAQLVARMNDGHRQTIPVTDAGRLTGIVTRSDLLAALARALVDARA